MLYIIQGKLNGIEAQKAFTDSLQAAMHQMQHNLRVSSPFVTDFVGPTTSTGSSATANSSPAPRAANTVSFFF